MDRISDRVGLEGKRLMKVAVVGCGLMAHNHTPYILKTAGVQLVGVCDQNELRAQEMAKRYNLPYYTSMTRMLEETGPQAVHIITPPQTHAALAVQALQVRCHVLVEKPLCLTSEEADAIYAAACAAGRQVSVDHTFLWSTLVQKARREVYSGRLGRVLHIQYVMSDDYLQAVKGGYARWALELRGGALCDLIPHPLYLIRSFLPEARVVSTRACGMGIYDLSELWVDFAAPGSGASLWMSLNQRPLEHALRIYLTGGIIHVDLRNFCIAVVPERSLPGPISRLVNTLSESWQRGMGTLGNAFGVVLGRFDPRAGVGGAIQAFYQAIAEGKPSPVKPGDARAVVELSGEIWDGLEGTPGAILPPVDEKQQVIVHKTPMQFARIVGDNRPRVLVTGGTGFIGSHLVRRLVSEGLTVRVLCRPASRLDSLPAQGVELIFGDVSDLDSVHQAVQGIEVLYHLAATMGGDWATHYQGTVVGTRNILQASAEVGVRKVVHVSSLDVLHTSHFPNDGIIDETFPLEQRPEVRGYYPRAKMEAEYLAHEFAKDSKLPLCIVRPGILYGPGRAEFLSHAGFRIGNRLVLVVGLGGRRLGLTYVENLVDALLLAERNGQSTGRIYHIVDPDLPTVRKYIRIYRLVTGQQLTAFYLPVFLWTAGFRLLDGLLGLVRGSYPNLGYRLRSISKGPVFSTARAREELGWTAKVPFEKAMQRTYS